MAESREFLIAGAAHLLLLAALSMTWAVTQRPTAAVEAVPVEIVDISDIARITEPPKPSMRAAPQEVTRPTAPEPEPEPSPAPEPDPSPEPSPSPPTRPEPVVPEPAAKPAPAPEPKPKPIEKPERPPRPRERAAEKAPAKAEKAPAKAEKAPQRLDAEELASLIDRSLPRAKVRPRDTSEFATSIEKSMPAGAKLDARAAATLEQAIRSQIAPCWNPPLGADGAGRMTVVLGIELARDGSIVGSPEIVSQTGVTAANRGYARSFAESARRAVLRCAPLELPADMYDAWRDFELNFDPSELA